MKRAIALFSLLCSSALVQAAGFHSLQFGLPEKTIQRLIPNEPALVAGTDSAASPLAGKYVMRQKIANQTFAAHFTFKNDKLEIIKFVGDRGVPAEQFTDLKAYYITVSSAIEKEYNAIAINTPPWKKASAIPVGKMQYLHAHQAEGFLVIAGIEHMASDGLFHIFFVLQPGTTALGVANIETGGRASDWDDSAPVGNVDEDTHDYDATLTGARDLGEYDENLEALILKAASDLKTTPRDGWSVLLKSAAKDKSGRAYWLLGQCYEKGIGTKKNAAKARDMYEKAARAGLALGLVEFGYDFPTSLKALNMTIADGKKLVETCRNNAEAGAPSALFNLGIMYRYGFGVRKNVQRAKKLFQKAAEAHDPIAAQELKELER